MANYASGPQWGEFIKGVDPGRSFADTFLQGFKQSIAYKLAEKEAKLKQQMEQQKQKALEDYRNLQMMVKNIEMKERQKQQQAVLAEQKRYHDLMTQPSPTEQFQRKIIEKIEGGGQLDDHEKEFMKLTTGLEEDAIKAQIQQRKASAGASWALAEQRREDDQPPVTIKEGGELWKPPVQKKTPFGVPTKRTGAVGEESLGVARTTIKNLSKEMKAAATEDEADRLADEIKNTAIESGLLTYGEHYTVDKKTGKYVLTDVGLRKLQKELQ